MNDFKSRNENPITEIKTVEYLDYHNINHTRYGMDALKSESPIWKIPALIRSAPDYIIFNEKNDPLFLEAKGFMGIIKIKLEDIKHYTRWNNHMDIQFLLYDIREDSYSRIMFNDILKIIKNKKPRSRSYPEGKVYYEIRKEWVPEFKTIKGE